MKDNELTPDLVKINCPDCWLPGATVGKTDLVIECRSLKCKFERFKLGKQRLAKQILSELGEINYATRTTV